MSVLDNIKLKEFGDEFISRTDNRFAPQSTFTAGVNGLVPSPTSEDISKGSFLKADGTWVSSSGNIVTWAQGTDQEIADMVAAADAGLIDLRDYWSVGDERVVHLSAMTATGVNESHVAQDVTFVLMDIDNPNYEYVTPPSSGETHCRYVVGLKNGLTNGNSPETGYVNPSNATGGWSGSARRTWCNNTFRNSIPSTLRQIFKQVKIKAMNGNNPSNASLVISNDYFFLPSAKDADGRSNFSVEDDSYNCLLYYKNSANKIKNGGNYWWTRSPYIDYKYNTFWTAFTSGGYTRAGISNSLLIVPHGCI